MPITIAIPRPGADEYFNYYETYIRLVPGDDAMPTLERHVEDRLVRLPAAERRGQPHLELRQRHRLALPRKFRLLNQIRSPSPLGEGRGEGSDD